MSEVVGVVHLRPAEGKADEVIAALSTAIEQTHAEEGCLAYALHRDLQDPNHLVLVERWRSQADLDEHMTKPYIAELFTFMSGPDLFADAPSLAFVQSVPVGDPAKGAL